MVATLRTRMTDTEDVVGTVEELEVVAARAAPYAARQDATNLVGFAPRDATHWESESWRDSGAGYANGRFAMDINAIWVPMALDGIGEIIDAIHAVGLPISGATLGPTLARYLVDRSVLQAAERHQLSDETEKEADAAAEAEGESPAEV